MGLVKRGVLSFTSSNVKTTVAVLDCRSALRVSTARTYSVSGVLLKLLVLVILSDGK